MNHKLERQLEFTLEEAMNAKEMFESDGSESGVVSLARFLATKSVVEPSAESVAQQAFLPFLAPLSVFARFRVLGRLVPLEYLKNLVS